MSNRAEVKSRNLSELPTGHCIMSGVEAQGILQINIPDDPEDYDVAPVKLTRTPEGAIIRRVDMQPIQVVDRAYRNGKIFRQPIAYIALKAASDPDTWRDITPGSRLTNEDLFGNFIEIVARIAGDKVSKNRYQYRWFEE